MKKKPSPFFKGEHFPILLKDAPSVVTEGVNTFRIENTKLVNRMIARLVDEPIIAVDTETNGLNPFSSDLFLIQIATPTHCFVIDVQKCLIDWQKGDLHFWEKLRPILEEKTKLKLLQNAKFDYKMLKAKGNIEMNNIYDTMLAERLLTAGTKQEVNLAVLAKKYSNKSLDKRVRATFVGLTRLGYMSQSQLEYAADDVFSLFNIYKLQLEELRRQDLLPLADLEFSCIPAVAEMELAGVRIDTDKWREIIKEAEEKKTEIQKEIMTLLPGGRVIQTSLFGPPTYQVNLNSGQQIISEMKKLGIDLPDTSEKTLKNNKSKHEAIGKLLEYRKQEKIISAFGEELLAKIDSITGRLHPEFNQYGANTGRFSSANPNVQQIPSGSNFRQCFVARPGYKMVVCDYSSCEIRIIAQLSGDIGFIGALNNGVDLHKYAASKMFGKPIEEITKDSPERKIAKFINFGLAYGMAARGLSELIDKPVEECDSLIESYFQSFPKVKSYLDKVANEAIKTGVTFSPMGRKLFYNLPDKSNPDYKQLISRIKRQAMNMGIQSCNADMLKASLVFVRNRIIKEKLNARIVNAVHDEVVVEVVESEAELVKTILEEEMIRAGEMFIDKVPVVAEPTISDCWTK